MGAGGRRIRLAAIFEPGKPVHPVWFELDRRKHEIRETTYRWRGKAGEAVLLYFSVSDGTALFELIYNTEDQSWTLSGIEVM